jgi:drug/metabolite transporter (DMT)-like permease
VVRGLCLLGSTVFNFIALGHLQLAETMTIAFSAPFLIALLSGLFLGERIEPARWGAIVVGFAGVLLVTRPTGGSFDPMMLVAFANIVCYAVYAMITRLLAGVDSSQSMLLIPAGVAVAALAPTLIGHWVTPQGASTWGLLLVIGVFGAAGHMLLILAFSRAPASVVAPFTYTQIVWMTLSGWVFFGDVPGGWTIAGAVVVIASGLWLLWQERRRRPAGEL